MLNFVCFFFFFCACSYVPYLDNENENYELVEVLCFDAYVLESVSIFILKFVMLNTDFKYFKW